MLPYVTVLSRSVSLYGVMAAAGLLAALLYLKTISKRRHPALEADGELVLIWGVVGAFFGSKALWLATVWPALTCEFRYLFTEPSVFLSKYLYGGFIFYGGLYGALCAVWIYAGICRLNRSDLLRAFLPVIPLIHSFGRIGCFCMGCCYGRHSTRFGIAFHQSEIAPNDIPLIPVQLYEAALELLLFLFLDRKSANGTEGTKMLGLYLATYGLSRFCLEFLRGDSYRGVFWGISLSQILSLPTVLWGVALLLLCRRRRREPRF